MRKFLLKGFQLFDIPIDIVLTFEFCIDITIWEMTIFDKVDYIRIEPALNGMHCTSLCFDAALWRCALSNVLHLTLF